MTNDKAEPARQLSGGTKSTYAPKIIIALVAAGLLIGVIVWLASSGGTHRPATTQRATTTVAPASSVARTQLVGLLQAGNRLTVHVLYKLTSTDPAADGGSVSIELWRQPPLVRQESTISAPGHAVTQNETFVTSTGTVACSQPQSGGSAWTCSSSSSGTVAGALVQQITSQLSGATVTERNGSVAGQLAKCFTIRTSGSTPESLCTSLDGVPVRVNLGAITLTLVSRDTTIPPSTFTLPAPVSSTSG